MLTPPQQNVKLSSFTSRSCNDSKEITKNLDCTCKVVVLQLVSNPKQWSLFRRTLSIPSSSSPLPIAFRAKTKGYPVQCEHLYPGLSALEIDAVQLHSVTEIAPESLMFLSVNRSPIRMRVLKCDVIKMKFLKLWDLLGYSERTMSKRPICQKWAFLGKLSLRS